MKKVIVGAVGLALLAGGGYLGFQNWVKNRARAEVNAVFSALSRTGASASYRDAAFAIGSRTLTVSGIDLKSADGSTTLKVETLTARGIAPPSDGKVKADAVDLRLVQIVSQGAGGIGYTYAIPEVTLDNYAGPAALVEMPAGPTRAEALRATLRHFAQVRASRLSIPDLKARFTIPVANAPEPTTAEIAYTKLVAERLDAGRTGSLRIERMDTSVSGGGLPGKTVGSTSALAAAGIDTAPILAALEGDATGGADGPVRPILESLTTGPYQMEQPPQSRVTASGLALEKVGIRPAAFTPERLAAIETLSATGEAVSPDELKRLTTLVGEAFSGVALGRLALSDMVVKDDTGTGRFAAVEMTGLADGRLGEFVVRAMEATETGGESISIGRFAIKDFRFDRAMAQASESVASGSEPSAHDAPRAFQLLSGFSITDLKAPYEGKAGAVGLKELTAAWGDLAGDKPSRLDVRIAGLSSPISVEDGEPFSYLAKAGITTATMGGSFGLAYDPASGLLTLAPASLEVEKAFAVDMEASLSGVPRNAFGTETEATEALMGATIGPVRVTVKNLGLAELMLKQWAADQGQTPEDLKAEILQTVDGFFDELAAISPDLQSVSTAVKDFFANPRTLTLALTPRAKATIAELVLGADPAALAESFSLTATTGP